MNVRVKISFLILNWKLRKVQIDIGPIEQFNPSFSFIFTASGMELWSWLEPAANEYYLLKSIVPVEKNQSNSFLFGVFLNFNLHLMK